MEDEMFIAAQAKKEEESNNKKGLSTGAKRAFATVGVLAVLAGGIAATYIGMNHIKGYKETQRAESLVAAYIDGDRLVTLPGEVVINKAYDAKYCTGEKLINELTEANAQYCYIDGEYYTEKGETIAILSLEVTRTETIDAIKVDVGGNTVYMAPEGYVLQGTKCSKETVTYETKVVAKSEDNDYSHVMIEGASKATILGIEEVQTKKYFSMKGYDLIVDVADNAKLENNQTTAELRLVPRHK
jgi:hypothetical protein